MKAPEDMMAEMGELLHRQGGFYTFPDVLACIQKGTMQSFSDGRTWVITQVHEFPRRKVVDVAFAIGDLSAVRELEPEIEKFARSIGASMLTASGRDGWWGVHTPGWRKLSTNYARDL